MADWKESRYFVGFWEWDAELIIMFWNCVYIANRYGNISLQATCRKFFSSLVWHARYCWSSQFVGHVVSGTFLVAKFETIGNEFARQRSYGLTVLNYEVFYDWCDMRRRMCRGSPEHRHFVQSLLHSKLDATTVYGLGMFWIADWVARWHCQARVNNRRYSHTVKWHLLHSG